MSPMAEVSLGSPNKMTEKIGFYLAVTLFVASVVLFVASIVNHQLDPTLGSALGIPIANVVSLVLAIIGLITASVVKIRKTGEPRTPYLLLAGGVLVLVWLVLLPLSDGGYFTDLS